MQTSASAHADIAQRSLDYFWGAPAPQLLDNANPLPEDGNATFNYWWLAHVIDCRVDAFERTGDAAWLHEARAAYDNLVERNGGSLFNDYFDDMLWLALAADRLAGVSGDPSLSDAAVAIWEHVVEHGWNDTLGASLAWRKPQLDYKNTPANGPLVILSLRLERITGQERYREIADAAWEWWNRTLVDPETGFVEDGINREGDGRIDTQWRFTYNQGLYLGAATEYFRSTGDRRYLELAGRTARTAIRELSDGAVFADEGDGGDEGLFKGVYYRYLGCYLDALEDGDERELHRRFVIEGTDALWETHAKDGWLRAGNDWRTPETGVVPYSTQLSAIMALELRARL